MGSFEPFDADDPFENKVKCLPEEDLLEIWVESQQLETMLNMQAPGHDFNGESFERAIVHELALRVTQKLVARRV